MNRNRKAIGRSASMQSQVKQQSLAIPQESLNFGAHLRDRIAKDLNLTPADASAIVGNFYGESRLQAGIQETAPTAGRGGLGYAQWTGPRRQQFEAYARFRGLSTDSDAANYGFFLEEIKSQGYAGVLTNLRKQKTVQGKAASFMRTYERPAVRNAVVRGNFASQFARARTIKI